MSTNTLGRSWQAPRQSVAGPAGEVKCETCFLYDFCLCAIPSYWLCYDGTRRCYAETTWWRHQMETFSALLALCAGNSPVTGEFPAQRPVTRSFGVFFDLRLTNGWVNNRNVGDLRHHFAHYDVTVMELKLHTHITIKSQDLNTRSWLTSSPTLRQMSNRECHPGGYYWNYSPGALLYI